MASHTVLTHTGKSLSSWQTIATELEREKLAFCKCANKNISFTILCDIS